MNKKSSMQMSLFPDEMFPEIQQPKDWIIISLHPTYYDQVKSGIKKYEYRRGTFISEPATAFVYCTVPRKIIGMIIELGQPVFGHENVARLKESEVRGGYKSMMNWVKDFKNCCAVPIKSVISFNEISLYEIKKLFPGFQPPQTFQYLDKNPRLLAFLKQRAGIERNG